MEHNEISHHEVSIFLVMSKNKQRWFTSKEIANESGVAPRTARAHCLNLVRLGLLDQAKVFPAHRYRWAEKADKRNIGYLQRLELAAEVFRPHQSIA